MYKKFLISLISIALAPAILAFAPAAKTLAVVQKPTIVRPTSSSLFDKPSLDDLNENSSEAEIQAALDEFKKQNQIKAFGFLVVFFSAFVYLKLQYDLDPSNFVGSS
jgi:hypothetical protein